MATAGSRRSRARESEQIVADFLKPVFPDAARVAASLSGVDVLNTPGWLIEVKARRGLQMTEWLKQADRRGSGIPIVVSRPDGYGAARVDQWAVIMRLSAFREIADRLARAEAALARIEREAGQ